MGTEAQLSDVQYSYMSVLLSHAQHVRRTLSTNNILQALKLCHLPVVESCNRVFRNFVRCFPSFTGKGISDTKIKQFFTYYLIQRYLILYD
jgi:hypothetical protein